MRKGFVQIAVPLVIGAFVIATGFLFWQKQPHDPPAPKVGTATQTGNFPVSLNNFQDNDVINAGDWNAIESAIGIAGSSSSTSLNYKLTNSASIDPGHKHTTAGVSGQIAVAQGGTGTSTLTLGALLMGNGTGTVQSVAQNGNGSIPIASGTTWAANTITAGSGISVTNGGGSITITNNSDPDLIYASTTDKTVTATTTETNLFSVSIPANTLGTSTVVRGTAYFNSFDTNGSTDSFQFVLKYGTARLATTTLHCSGFAVGGGCLGRIDFDLFGAGATNSQEASMHAQFTAATTTARFGAIGGFPSAYASSTQVATLNYGSSAIDSTSAQNLALTITNSSVSVNQSATMSRYLIWRVKQ